MKIVFIADEDQEYGAAKSLFELVTCLTNYYHIKSIVLTCNYGTLNRKLTAMNIENHVTGHLPFLIGEGSTKLKKFLKKYFKLLFYIRYRIKNWIALKKVKHLIDFANVDLIYTNVNRIDFGATLSKKYNIPHIWHIREFGDIDYKLFSLRKNFIEYMNNNTNLFIAISKAVEKAWIKKGLEKSKIKMVYNGIDTSKIKIKNQKNNISHKVNIVFTGSINDTKKQIHAIKALSLLPKEILKDIHIDFYGSGTKEYLSYLKKIIDQNNLHDHITFMGYNENVVDKLSNYDVGMICSRSEGFGRVTIEYMATGLCVIASNTGANSELIKNYYTGLLYEYGNIEDLASKLIYIVQNRSRCITMGYKAREHALQNFTKERNAKEIYSVILNVLGKKQ